MADQRVRWTYENSDREVEGSPDQFREMQERAGDLARGAPVLLQGDAGEPEASVPSPADDGEPASPDPESLIEHTGGGWYSVEGLEDKVKGREAASVAAEELIDG